MRSNPPLQPIEEYGRRFAQGQAVAFGGGERGFGGEGVHLEALAGEGAGGAGQLPGSVISRTAGREAPGWCWPSQAAVRVAFSQMVRAQELPAMRLGASPGT